MSTLAAYYESLGYPKARWHIGAEHPLLEEYAIRLLGSMPAARVLEVGYQAGGFAVPLILAMHRRPDFAYVGIDSLAYGSAVEGAVIARYLEARGVSHGYEFIAGDARERLLDVAAPFDLVLIDHDKRFYPRDLRTMLRRELVSGDGCVLLHDVLGKARRVWPDCLALARAYGWVPSIVEEVPEGLAVLRREPDAACRSLLARLSVAGATTRIWLREWRERLRTRG